MLDPELRSLNLSTSVALALYEVRRQWGWDRRALVEPPGSGRDVERLLEVRGRRTSVARPTFSSSTIVYQPMSSCSGRPAEARRAGAVVVVLVPVLALEEVHQRQPADVLRGRLVGAGVLAHVADAVDEALRVQREHQTNRPSQKNAASPNGSPIRTPSATHRDLHAGPEAVRGRVDVLAVLLDRRRARLPEPAQVRPPEAADARAGDVLGRVGLGVVQAVIRGPRQRRSRAVQHREEGQHVAHHRVQLHRLVGERAVEADGGAEPAQEVQRGGGQRTSASPAAAPRSGPRCAPTWISIIQKKRRSVAAAGAPPGLRPGRMLGDVGGVQRGQARLSDSVMPLTHSAALPAAPRAARRRAAASWSASTSGLPVVSSFSP